MARTLTKIGRTVRGFRRVISFEARTDVPRRSGGDMQRQLVERAIAGDHDAFSVLARAAYPRLHGVARLILRDPERAQDAVQEALVRAWQHVRALRDPDAWDAWLHRLTVNACYRWASKVKRRGEVELHVTPDLEPVYPHDFVTTVAERDRMGRAIGRLPIDVRTVVVLHFYADLPLTQVADVLEIPVGTVKSRLNRALAAMRTFIAPEQPAPPVGRVGERTA
jgi:RNA polymerase sigma-70 factor (ECF subfamily)